MSLCAIKGCDAPATHRASDYRRSRRVRGPAIRLVCEFHARGLGNVQGVKVRSIESTRTALRSSETIDIRAALKRAQEAKS